MTINWYPISLALPVNISYKNPPIVPKVLTSDYIGQFSVLDHYYSLL